MLSYYNIVVKIDGQYRKGHDLASFLQFHIVQYTDVVVSSLVPTLTPLKPTVLFSTRQAASAPRPMGCAAVAKATG